MSMVLCAQICFQSQVLQCSFLVPVHGSRRHVVSAPAAIAAFLCPGKLRRAPVVTSSSWQCVQVVTYVQVASHSAFIQSVCVSCSCLYTFKRTPIPALVRLGTNDFDNKVSQSKRAFRMAVLKGTKLLKGQGTTRGLTGKQLVSHENGTNFQ